MANSTRSSLRSDLRIELKKDPNWKIWSDSALNTYLKQAYLKIQKDWNFQWRENQANTTFSTVVWTQQYSLPSDLWKIELVRYNWTVLYKDTKVSLKKQYSSFVSWIPSKYYIFWSYIWFDVLPDAVWTIDLDYLANNDFVTDDSTLIDFPPSFDVAIVKYAAFLAWSSIDGKQWTAQTKLQEYQIEIDGLLSSFNFDDINDLTVRLQRRNYWVTVRENVLDY